MKFIINRNRNLDFHIIRKFIERRYKGVEYLADDIAEFFKNMSLYQKNQKFIRLLQKKIVFDEEFEDFISDWDIDVKGGTTSIFLACFMKMHFEVTFPNDVALKLKGLLEFYKFINMELLSYCKKVAMEFQKENIDILLLKGAAMKYYRPDLPRVMEDVDILVRNEEDYQKAIKILEREEFSDNNVKHSIYYCQKESDTKMLDVHSKLYILSDKAECINEDLFKRAVKDSSWGVDNVFVPCIEDTFFIILLNFLKNSMHGRSCYSIFNIILDSQYLLNKKSDFDWEILKENAKKAEIEPHLHIAIKVLNQFLENKLPEICEKEFFDYSAKILFDNWFLKVLNERNKHYNIGTIINDCLSDIKKFFEYKTQYFLYTREKIRNNPSAILKVLQKHNIIK